ncbi:c-type cytochrome [Janthinobacterium fluminis]|uniref:Cytochrome c n=1 Tax=Janthinobacterium fluminis TaxID=2987524 RepID=A0ABT5K551_9BURK|nr:cytochrome c [Janthinobacterium fluminis]MDC8760133.1 cytochrome c [Janthinobacterium fluminis]
MKKTLSLAAALLLAAGATRLLLWPADDIGPPAAASTLTPEALVARGAYLAKAGDCMACHTTRGGAAYAGGRALQTPFGSVVSPNITSDRETGIGAWSADDFWRALHNGKSKDGRMLYPAFPYTNYTKVKREDADAMYAFFQSVPAQKQANLPHQLRFPYNQPIALAAWRALYFKPAVYAEATGQSVEWNRGAYLVQGLGHCSACHSSRNPLGASDEGLSGGLIPILGWYAPSLTSDAEAGLGDWDTGHIAQLLKTGVSPRATVFGPMAEVVQASLQHLDDADVNAMAVYLKTLPGPAQPRAVVEPDTSSAAKAQLAAGAKLYENHCVECHRADGTGMPPAYPPLAGNRALTTTEAVNPIRIVLNGGFAPGTAGNPRPYGMPAYGPLLSDAEVAAVVTYLRSSWGNKAGAVSALEVNRYRSVPLD